MAFELHRSGWPAIAASQIDALAPVRRVPGERRVAPVATANQLPFGVGVASAAIGEAITVFDEGNTVEVLCAASLAGGAELAYSAASKGFIPAAGASGALVFSVGQAAENAVAGERFAFYVNPRALSGLV